VGTDCAARVQGSRPPKCGRIGRGGAGQVVRRAAQPTGVGRDRRDDPH